MKEIYQKIFNILCKLDKEEGVTMEEIKKEIDLSKEELKEADLMFGMLVEGYIYENKHGHYRPLR